jgi:hypothetical protein
MPFLFVDYDQGAGGEYFCANLSNSPECVTLDATEYATGRTKIRDRFDNEFLKFTPNPIAIQSHPTLYDVVPTHRFTDMATKLLHNVQSIRIKNPVDQSLWLFLKDQQVKKVLLAVEPSDKYFVGFVRLLYQQTQNKDFLKKVKRDMNNITLLLMSENIEPSDNNINRYIRKQYTQHWSEPEVDYDLVISYEDLLFDVAKVQADLLKTFNISTCGNWLYQYKKNYDAWHKQA